METSEKLAKGISMLYDMELNLYCMSKSIDLLNNKIRKLCIRRHFNKPELQTQSYIFECVFKCAAVLGVIGAVIGFVNGLVKGFRDFGKDVFLVIIGGIFIILIVALLNAVLYGLIGIVPGAVIGWIWGLNKTKKAKEEAQKLYDKELAIYHNNITIDDKRMKSEARQREILQEQVKNMRAKFSESKTALNEYYDIMGIDRNYRNLIPIGRMNDLIRLGISDKLDGIDGLNNLVRRELREDQLKASIDDLRGDIKDLLAGQNEIYARLSEFNNKSEILIEAVNNQVAIAEKNNVLLNEAVKNSELAVYTAERTREEMLIRDFMMHY